MQGAHPSAAERFSTKGLSNFAITEAALKILYISQYFPPEMGAPAARVSELSQRWVQAGHEVTVLTGFPNHPDGIIRPEYRKSFRRMVFRERVHDVNVVRSWLLPFPNRRPLERMLNYSSFLASAAITGSFLGAPDAVIASSPQLLVGLAGWWISRLKHVPFIFEVRDLWPESLVAVGVGNARSALHRSLAKIAAFLYRKADHIVVVTPAFREFLMSRWQVSGEKISVVPNGVETRIFSPRFVDQDLRKNVSADGKFVASFIGTMGLAHGLDTLVAAAERFQKTEPDILFMLVGDGADRERITGIARSKGLTNIRFVPQQLREKIPDYIALSDACLVLLKKSEVFETVIPTKMLEFMSCAKPVILGVAGQAREIIESSRAGICVEPENAEQLCEAILKLRNQEWLRESLGRNGRDYIIRKLSRERTADEYLQVLNEVIPQVRSSEAAVAA
jgi:colanic acid biosynthesis glycosyl transferase WcaI